MHPCAASIRAPRTSLRQPFESTRHPQARLGAPPRVGDFQSRANRLRFRHVSPHRPPTLRQGMGAPPRVGDFRSRANRLRSRRVSPHRPRIPRLQLEALRRVVRPPKPLRPPRPTAAREKKSDDISDPLKDTMHRPNSASKEFAFAGWMKLRRAESRLS